MSGTIYTGTSAPGAGRRAGIVSLTVDGEAVDVASDLAYDPTLVKRESLPGQSGIQGFSENYKTGMMSFKARDSGAMTVAAWMQKTSSTIVATLANGKTVYGDLLWCTECGEVATGEATFDVKFEGTSITEATI